MGPLQLFAQRNMIVNLAVYRKCAARSNIEKGLRAMLHVNDGEPLVREYCALVCIYSAPVRPAMSDHFRHFQRAGAHRFERFLELEDTNEAAQSDYPAILLIIADGFSDERIVIIRRNLPIDHNVESNYIIYRHINQFWQL